MKKLIGISLFFVAISAATFVFAKKYVDNKIEAVYHQETTEIPNLHPVSYTTDATLPDGGGYVNLEQAAEISSKAVVHIKTEIKARTVQYSNPWGDDIFERFFGPRNFQSQPQQGSGSGVIVTKDGYIVTNNHVVDNADEVTVILNNKKSIKAKVIGKDAATDLAVLKVDEPNLPYLSYGNSDDVKLGQWVLAVGYPLTLETTVTAGIVSAKYRNIGMNKAQGGSAAIESFIQTDAAVNPGNSGGALVNSKGELIGINTAIASPTGSYAGYSFAIPSNIVKKVVDDMMNYGNVQRAYLGVSYLNLKEATAEEISAYNLDKIDGVYINSVMKESSAEKAGLQKGDIITRIEDKEVKTGTQMLEKIAQYRPGDAVNVEYIRNGKKYTTTAKLKNIVGKTDLVKSTALSTQKLGIQVRNLDANELRYYRLKNGVLISNIKPNGIIAAQTRMKKNFVILKINDNEILSVDDLDKYLAEDTDEFQITGMYPGYANYYIYTIQNNR